MSGRHEFDNYLTWQPRTLLTHPSVWNDKKNSGFEQEHHCRARKKPHLVTQDNWQLGKWLLKLTYPTAIVQAMSFLN